AQGPVVHVEHARPENAATVDAERIAPVDVIVQHRSEQIVRRGDCVEVTGEMKVDVVHRYDLGLPAAGRTALLPKTWTKARLTQDDRCLLAQEVERVAQPDGRRRLALARLGRIDRRDQDELAGLAALERLHERRI